MPMRISSSGMLAATFREVIMNRTCTYCDGDMGPGEIPMNVDREVWCPACFCYVRSPLEPERFPVGAYFPVLCQDCRVTSVAMGVRACNQCGSRRVQLTLPKTFVDLPA